MDAVDLLDEPRQAAPLRERSLAAEGASCVADQDKSDARPQRPKGRECASGDRRAVGLEHGDVGGVVVDELQQARRVVARLGPVGPPGQKKRGYATAGG